MYRRFLFISMLSLFLLMIFSGCKKSAIEEATEPEPVVSLSEDFMFDNTVYTKSLDELARLVAFGMKDKEFRIFIKQQAEKQIDGDYDVIYEFTKDKAVKGKSTLEDYLHHIAGVYFGKSGKVDKLISNVKNFQISVPVNCESWDAENYEPLVTYIPESFDEKTFKFVKAYDSQGHVYVLPLDKEPDRPVIVLGSCERMDRVRRGKPVPPGDDAGTGNYHPPIDTTGWNNGGGNGGSTPRVREDGMTEYLSWIKIENLSVIEPWVQGKPELGVYYVLPFYRDHNIVQALKIDFEKNRNFKLSRASLENGSFVWVPLFKWDWKYGDFYVLRWYETDRIGKYITYNFFYSDDYYYVGYGFISFYYLLTARSWDVLFSETAVRNTDLYKTIYKNYIPSVLISNVKGAKENGVKTKDCKILWRLSYK